MEDSARRSLPRVLVVDDDPDVLASMLMVLADAYDVTGIRDVRAALAALEKQQFDVVVIDIMMPVLDGMSFVREARAVGVETPFVLCSAAGGLAKRAREVGAAAYLTKPFDIEHLEEVLARCCRGG